MIIDPVKQSIRMLESGEEAARRKNIINSLSYYNFDKVFINKQVAQYINRSDNDIPYTLTNFTTKIINNKSVIYKQPAVRINDSEKYRELTKRKNSRMKVIERQTNLLGRVAVRPLYDVDRKIFDYEVLQYFLPTEIKNGKVKMLAYPWPNEYKNKKIFAVWTEEEYYVTSHTGVRLPDNQSMEILGTERIEHGYGIVPYSFPFIQYPLNTFWVAGGEDIVQANEMVNLGLTLLNYLTRYASFKQAYAKGENVDFEKQVIQLGYDKLATITGVGVDIGVIDIQANLQQVTDAIKFQIETVLHNNNLSSRFGGDGSATSGFQLIVENIDLLNMWEDMVDIWRENEDDLYEVEKVVAQKDANIALPKDMVVDFAEVRFPVSKEEERAQDDWDLQKKLITPLDIMKRRSPDTPEEDLKKQLIENGALDAEIEREVKATQPKPPGLLERLNG